MLTAGVSKGLGNEMGLLEAEKNLQSPLELEHHVKQGLVHGLSKIGVEGILSRDDFSKVLERSLREGVANTTGGFMSSQIGLMSKTGEIDPVTQKIAHAAIGAAEAAIMDGHPVAGAIGAVVGEMVGEMYRDQKEKEGLFNPNNEDFLEMVDQGVDIARFTAASVACLMGEDPEIAALTAGNAARYNAMFVIPSIVKGSLYVAGVALTIHEACEVYELYQTQGAEAALNRLAVDGAVIVVTGGIGKGVHKAYQVGTKMYPSAALAWEAVQAQSPVFYAMGQKIVGAKEWVKKGIVAFDEATEKLILKTRTKIAQEEGFEVSKLSHEAKQKMLGEKILKQEEDFRPKHQLKQYKEEITDLPENRVTYEKYLSERRANLTREEVMKVKDPELKQAMDNLYREGDKIGAGGTGNAIRYERETGLKVGGKDHTDKGNEYITFLEKWLKNRPSERLIINTNQIKLASDHDRLIAEQVLIHLKESLGNL